MDDRPHATDAKSMDRLIEQLDEEKVIGMLDAEGRAASGAEADRVQKRLLEDLGLFAVDLDDYDLSDDLVNRVRRLKYVNVESDARREYSEETERRVAERMRELGFEPDEDD
ncbi:hypothetical protein GCM10027435_15630 [Haloparvum alkalitolerans]|uniref:hypothetical protein n=1 Tax=Haloparvum alkalitolerans TaxID=1042953 RepID=UPI003CF6C64F